ncbi:hypothetical protein H8E07_20955 [bacterium]|nr:hypothetical protein [bacterium]
MFKLTNTLTLLLAAAALALSPAPPAGATEDFPAPLLQAGEDERIEGTGACPVEPDFLAGSVSTAYSLHVGGNAWGCDSEWGASAEFDLTAFVPGQTILAAEFVVRKTGHEEGLPYVAAFGYEATGAEVPLPRADLDMYSALDIVAPGQANVDLHFTVTGFVQDLIDDGAARAGLFLCGVYSEVGRMDRIYVGGTPHAFPPRLIITTEGPVGGETATWSGIKTIYR